MFSDLSLLVLMLTYSSYRLNADASTLNNDNEAGFSMGLQVYCPHVGRERNPFIH